MSSYNSNDYGDANDGANGDVNSDPESSERLKNISHHFFSHTKRSAETNAKSLTRANAERRMESLKPTTFLPVLLDSYKQDSYVFGINDYFNAKMKSCTVVNIDSALQESLPVATLLGKRLGNRKSDLGLANETDVNRYQIDNYLKGLELNPEICLLPYVSHQISLLNDGDFLLVIVPASLAGVSRVFNNIEKICANLRDVVIGVVVVNANSMRLSQLCYEVIDNSISSFLGLKSIALGHLLSDTAVDLNRGRAIQFSEEVDKLNSAPIELEDIANSIWDNFITLLTQNRTMNVLTQMSDPSDTRHPYLSVSA